MSYAGPFLPAYGAPHHLAVEKWLEWTETTLHPAVISAGKPPHHTLSFRTVCKKSELLSSLLKADCLQFQVPLNIY